jgi:hypothetical protein
MSRGFRNLARSSARTAVAALVLASALAAAPTPARADATQLCRAGMNLVLAPFDVIMAPYIAAKDEYYGLTEIDDPMALKVVGAAPGYVLLLGLQVGGAIFREIAGVFEIIPGVVTLFREGAQPPLFRSQEEAWAVYSEEMGPCPVKLGVSYNTINDG